MIEIPELSKQGERIFQETQKRDRCRFIIGSHQEVGGHRKHVSDPTALMAVECDSHY